MKTQRTLAIFLLLGNIQARITQGQCANQPAAMQNLDIDKFKGSWHPVMADKESLEGLDASCVKAHIGRPQDFKWLKKGEESSSSSEDEGEKEKKQEQEQEGEQKQQEDQPKGTERMYSQVVQLLDGRLSGLMYTCEVNTQGDALATGYFAGTEIGQGRLLDSDYENYMLCWSCINIDENKKFEKMGLAVRDPDATDEQIQDWLKIAQAKLEEAQKDSQETEPYTIDMLTRVTQGTKQCEYWAKK